MLAGQPGLLVKFSEEDVKGEVEYSKNRCKIDFPHFKPDPLLLWWLVADMARRSRLVSLVLLVCIYHKGKSKPECSMEQSCKRHSIQGSPYR